VTKYVLKPNPLSYSGQQTTLNWFKAFTCTTKENENWKITSDGRKRNFIIFCT